MSIIASIYKDAWSLFLKVLSLYSSLVYIFVNHYWL
jgi:hypothetical protein